MTAKDRLQFAIEQCMLPKALACLRDFQSTYRILKGPSVPPTCRAYPEAHEHWCRRQALIAKMRGLIQHDRLLNGVRYYRAGPWPYRPRRVEDELTKQNVALY